MFRRTTIPLLATAVTAMALPARTAETNAAFNVTARVLAEARLAYLGEPPKIVITAVDIARGYVATNASMDLQVQSNSRAGYALELLPSSAWFRSVSIQGLDSDVVLGGDGGTIVQRWSAGGSVVLNLRFRFELGADARPGVYALPLQFQVRPLDTY